MPTLHFLLTGYACLYFPGLGLLAPSGPVLSSLFSRVLASAIVSTLVATGLAASDSFSLTTLLVCNSAVALAGFAWRRATQRNADVAPTYSSSPWNDRIGIGVVVVALLLYWPAYPSFLGASDSTAYVATGISLAHHGTLSRQDELGQRLSVPTRAVLFDSMSQVFGDSGPPYRRMPGAMLLQSLESSTVWPDFFPAPSVWAAIFTLAGVPWLAAPEMGAPGYAPVFAALALWAFWHLAWPWLGRGFGLVAVVLLGASAPFYYSARFPLSEPIAAFFALAALALIARGGANLRRRDALLAGAALGAAVFVRIDIALFLLLATALVPFFQTRPRPGQSASITTAPLPSSFLIAFVLVAALTPLQAVLVPGTYASPFVDHLADARIRYLLTYGQPSLLLIGGLFTSLLAMLAVCWRTIGLPATMRCAVVLGLLVAHASASNFLWQRTPMWLSFYIGWAGLGLGLVGAVLTFRDRARLPGAPLILGLLAACSLILFYNPHVYPSLPWGARRYVPMLLPLLILMGTYACMRAAAVHRALCVLGVGLLAYPIAAGGHPLWGKNLLEGTWEQLTELSAIIPKDGVILIDREISASMLGPALWLIDDRNSLPVPPTGSATGRKYLPGLVWKFGHTEPVYFVTRGVGNQIRVPKVRMELVAESNFTVPAIEQTYASRPEQLQRYILPIAVYRLHPALDARGILDAATGPSMYSGKLQLNNNPKSAQ